MNVSEYDKVVTDFYSQLFMDVSTGERVLKQGQTVNSICKEFVTQFNKDMAAPFVALMDERAPRLLQRAKVAPTHYWKSEQAEEYLYKILYKFLDQFFGEKETMTNKEQFHYENFGFYIETTLKLNSEQQYVNHYLDAITTGTKVTVEDMAEIRRNADASPEQLAYVAEMAKRLDIAGDYFQTKAKGHYSDDRLNGVYQVLADFFDVTLHNYMSPETVYDKSKKENHSFSPFKMK